MKILIYNESILSGGIEKSIENLINYLSIENEIEIVYVNDKKNDENIIKILEKKAKVRKLQYNEKIYADVCIWCRLYMDYDKLKNTIIANKNILWVHSRPGEKGNSILDDKKFIEHIDKIVCVSNTLKKMININDKSIVIHNFLPKNIESLAKINTENNIFNNNNILKLVTITRLSYSKGGFDRMLNLVKSLKDNDIEFEYNIIGKGREQEQEIKNLFKEYNEVKFLGYKENPYSYLNKADYLVLLSDFETWGNVITEAKILRVPVISTNFETIYEQIIDDYNGVIIDLKENDYSKYLGKIIKNKNKYKNNLKGFKYENEIQEWNNIL